MVVISGYHKPYLRKANEYTNRYSGEKCDRDQIPRNGRTGSCDGRPDPRRGSLRGREVCPEDPSLRRDATGRGCHRLPQTRRQADKADKRHLRARRSRGIGPCISRKPRRAERIEERGHSHPQRGEGPLRSRLRRRSRDESHGCCIGGLGPALRGEANSHHKHDDAGRYCQGHGLGRARVAL